MLYLIRLTNKNMEKIKCDFCRRDIPQEDLIATEYFPYGDLEPSVSGIKVCKSHFKTNIKKDGGWSDGASFDGHNGYYMLK